MKPTIGSLFAGIGGFDLGFERAGFETIWQVEINPWCRKVLAKNFPNAEKFEDIRDCSKYNMPRVDVIVGGFPCQDISVAGTGKGLTGERSGLWSEYARIVGELRPKFVLVENSPALTYRGLSRVLGDLAEIGYDAEWDCIPAAAVGAPHLRDRVWILAYPAGQRLPDGCFCFNKHDRPLEQGHIGNETFGGKDWKLVEMVQGICPGTAANWWQSQSRMVRSSNGFPDWVDRIKGLGNAVVPQIPEMYARRIKTLLAQEVLF